MNRESKIAEKVAKKYFASSSIDGKNRNSASRIVGDLLRKNTSGVFRDNSWVPVNSIFERLWNAGIVYELKSAKYEHSTNGDPSIKRWMIECPYVNNNGRDAVIYAMITASGAGPVEDPMSSYDIITQAT